MKSSQLVLVVLLLPQIQPLRLAYPLGRQSKVPTARSLSSLRLPVSCSRTSRQAQILRGGESPKLGTWIGPALSSALSYALYNIFIKLGSASIHPILGGVVLQFVAALLGTVLLGFSKGSLTYDRKGMLWSICAGLSVGAAEILSFQVSGMGVQASQSIPIMIGGSVVLGSVLGAVLLKERMSPRGWFGVILVIAGVACVATDPGAKMGAH